MASSSTAPQVQHDVFLSFRGEDTRNNFTSHLYAALHRKKIRTFIDDQLIRGDQISLALLKKIEGSHISVVIFSEGYASSRWCLEELEKILECRSSYGQVVIPVFYGVDPSDVRHQTGSFGNGFAKVEERFNGEPQKLQKWRDVLKEAAGLSGFDSNVIRLDSILIEDIVNDILKILNDESTLIVNKKLVGIDSRIEQIEGLLCNNRKIGIWGIGGIGKTTLAHAVFNKISKHFESSYFIQNIREESEKSNGLTDLRQRLVSAILEYEHSNLGFTFTTNRLGRKKLFIVFDDVTRLDQIESLIGDLDYLSSESRILITTRDKHVLENCKVDDVYEIQPLSHDAALQLFSQYAFSQDSPTEDFMQLSHAILTYVKGVPLALKVLGLHLFKRTKEDWESAINKLKRYPHTNIQKVLKVSYDGLDYEEQNIFLDIAFFFKGCNRDFIEEILDACGFHTRIGINVLIEKSLITQSSHNLSMHDLLQDMGKEVVRQESPDNPGKRSRLCSYEDIYSVLTKNTGTSAIRGICLHMSEVVREIHLKPIVFSKMHNLKFLQVHSSILEYDSISENNNKVHGFEFVKSDFSELRHFFWSRYSAKSLSPNFHPKSLVALDMQFSKLQQLLFGGQDLVTLKHINLRNSNNLLKIPNLSQTPNLKRLILAGCTSLNCKGCLNFNHLSCGIHLKFLQKLNLSECFGLKKVPFIPCSVEQLYLDRTTIKELPSIEHPSKLVALSLKDCSRLECLSNDISKLRSLQTLRLSGCSKLMVIPKISSKMIRELYLKGTAIKELPSLECPEQLSLLDLANCSRLESLPEDIYGLKSLSILWLSGCVKLDRLSDSLGDLKALRFVFASGFDISEMVSSIVHLNNLIILNLTDCSIHELPNNIGQLQSLNWLDVSGNNFESLPTRIKDLSKLGTLILSNCKRLQSLPELPHNLLDIWVDSCSSLEAISGLPRGRPNVWSFFQTISFMNCLKLDFNALPEMTNVLQQMQKNAYLWLRGHPCESTPPLRSICLPGSEIPEWFSCKSIGSFVELPAGWLNDKILGLAVCVVVSPLNNHKSRYSFVKFHLSINGLLIPKSPWPNLYVDKLESDHLFLGCSYDIPRTDKLHTFSSNSEGSIQFELVDGSGKAIENNTVKKCGVRFFHAKDYLRRDADADERMKRGKRKDCCGTDERINNNKKHRCD